MYEQFRIFNEVFNIMAGRVDIKKAVDTMESLIENPSNGLPDDVFKLISRITPLINVDLLIKNEQNQTLLTWRDDGYYKPGWHVPGGIIRYKEAIADRIRAVAKIELGTEVEFKAEPLALNERIHPSRKERGHFISLLYQCFLIAPPTESLRYQSGAPQPNQWMWHSACPENILTCHEMYRKFI